MSLYWRMAAPSAVELFWMSSDLPLLTFRTLMKPSPEGLMVHFWQLLLFEGQIWAAAPFAREAPEISSNLPLATPVSLYWPLPRCTRSHFWSSPPFQPHWTASVPSAMPPLTRSITLLLRRLANA